MQNLRSRYAWIQWLNNELALEGAITKSGHQRAETVIDLQWRFFSDDKFQVPYSFSLLSVLVSFNFWEKYLGSLLKPSFLHWMLTLDVNHVLENHSVWISLLITSHLLEIVCSRSLESMMSSCLSWRTKKLESWSIIICFFSELLTTSYTKLFEVVFQFCSFNNSD